MKTHYLKLLVLPLFFIALIISSNAQAKKFNIDPEHSNVGFKIRHLFSNVRGQFNTFSGSFDFDATKKSGGSLKISIQTASIDTNNEKRDKHLKSPDFFDVAKYPEIKFTSTKVESTGDKTYKVQGYLSMHGVTKVVSLDVDFIGEGKDPWGNFKAAFSAEAKVNRKDYGIEWNETLETGGFLLGNDVKISIEIEAGLAPTVKK